MRTWSIARRLFVSNVLFVVLLSAAVAGAVTIDTRDRLYAEAAQRMTSVAAAVAASPQVVQAAGTADPSVRLQPFAQQVMVQASADFVTIMAPDRTRWTHANPAEIGKPYIGTVQPALNGQSFTEITAGTLGPSVRAIVPVRNSAGSVVAMVAAGVTVANVDVAVNSHLPAVAGLALALLAAGSVAAWLLSRYLRRVTLGWGPEQLGRLFAYYEAVLHSAQDGLLLVDHGKVAIYNDRAAELLGLPRPQADFPAIDLPTLGLDRPLLELLLSGRSARDEVVVSGARVLVVSQESARMPTARRGPGTVSVATVADHTALITLGDELLATQTLATALRSQTHEHANRIHTLVSLMEMGRGAEALDFATKDLALSQRLADDAVSGVGDPVLSALLLGKLAQANERGITLVVDADGGAGEASLPAHDVVTIVGNLIDNALDAAAGGSLGAWVRVSLHTTGGSFIVRVEDSGPGPGHADLDQLATLGYTSKATTGAGRGVGLALVRQSVAKLGGTLVLDHEPAQSVPAGTSDCSAAGARFTVRLPLVGTEAPHGR